LAKNGLGISIYFSVQYLTVHHVSTADVDMWHYIKKTLKLIKNKKFKEEKKEEEEEPPLLFLFYFYFF
jgi:hypothetical protein